MALPLLALLLPSLVPVVSDGVRGLFSWLFGGKGAQPQNVEEVIRLNEAEVKKLMALAELDKPAGEISKWVADLRASFRYLAAALIIIGTITAVFAKGAGLQIEDQFIEILLDMSGSVFSFMFGDRMYLKLKSGGSK